MEQQLIPIKKIVIIGPESTGKSSLCEQLAEHYKTAWIKEYAREYLLANGSDYSFEQLLDVAEGQLKLEEAGLQKAGVESKTWINKEQNNFYPVFIDTDMYVMKVWCEFVFNKCHNWILNQSVERHYDLYLLCNIDIEWVKDELREYPDLETREKLYHYYKDIMINQKVPWVNIEGDYDQRLQIAIDSIDKLT